MRLGLLAILVGVGFLLKNLGFIPWVQWSILWPTVIIYIGIAIVARNRCWHCRVWHDGMYALGKNSSCNECDCNCEVCEDCASKRVAQ